MVLAKTQQVIEHSIGYLGPAGTYTEEMVLSTYLKQKNIKLVPYTSIDAVIRAVEAGEVTEGVVPIENSLEGSVNITLDTLAHEVNLFITKEMVQPIKHHLLIHKTGSIDKINVIVSHPQALAQCRQYINQNFPRAELKVVDSTAAAALLVAEGALDHAAIGGLRAGEIHGLKVVAASIEDQHNNCTRFIVLKSRPELAKAGHCKTSVVCKINGQRPGSLYELLSEFVKYDVNLTKIESRPARTGLGEYIFFLDLDGSIYEAPVRNAIKAVELKSLWFKNLGSYLCHIE
jgi:prephenate dehydratase